MLESLDFHAVAQRQAEELAVTLGHGALAGVIEAGQVVYLSHIAGSEGLRVYRRVGERRSVHVGARLARPSWRTCRPAGKRATSSILADSSDTPNTPS